MPITKSTKISTSEAIRLIEEARDAELCRDIPSCQRILSAVWENLEDEPALNDLEIAIQAEILRICGFFLSFYGRSRGLRDYQERGRNFLTKSIEMFDCENLLDKSAEAKVMLALCYWYEGAISESELILSETEAEYADNQLHPIYFQVCVTRLLTHYWKGEYPQALKIIKRLSIPIESCKDARLKTLFHNQAGITYQLLEKPDKAIFHLREAIKNARRSGNLRYAAGSLNNLGNVCKDIGDFAKAHQYVDRAFKDYTELQETGWAANVLDTKAQIYLAQNKLNDALIQVDEALKTLRQGEDFAGLVESLFTKCKALLRLSQINESVLLLAELLELAKFRIGEFAAKKYADEFSKLIYPLKNASYSEEVKGFKSNLLRKHLTEADLQITKTAETLGVTHQNLSDMLNKQFPELYDELGIRRRSRRNGNGKKVEYLKNIAPVSLNPTEMFFDGGLQLRDEASYYTFALSGRRLASLETKQNVIVLVESGEAFSGTTVIMQNQKTNDFHCGTLEMDKLTGIFYLNDSLQKDDFPFLVDDFKYYGKIVGYCLLEDDAGKEIMFRPF